MESRREVSPDELLARKDDEVFMSQLQVSGTAVIRDKDGNIKGEMQITSLDAIEETNDADN